MKKCYPEPFRICETKAKREWSKASPRLGTANVKLRRESLMTNLAKLLWGNEEGQDIAEYAVMLAVILVLVIGTIRLVGGNANNVFSSVASTIQ